jgi:hypothetical protein
MDSSCQHVELRDSFTGESCKSPHSSTITFVITLNPEAGFRVQDLGPDTSQYVVALAQCSKTLNPRNVGPGTTQEIAHYS